MSNIWSDIVEQMQIFSDIKRNEASGYRKVFFMRSKDKMSKILKEFFSKAEKETGRKAISLRIDGTEYINNKENSQRDEYYS